MCACAVAMIFKTGGIKIINCLLKMQKQFPTLIGSTALLFGLNGPKRKSLKRNSKGLEDFRQYFSDHDNTSDNTSSDSDADESIADTIPVLANQDSFTTDSHDNHHSLAMCSPKKLSFNDGPVSEGEESCSHGDSAIEERTPHNDGPVSEGEESCSHGDSAIEERTAHNLSDTIIIEESTMLKCKRKRRKKIVPPKRCITLPKHTESTEDNTKELVDVDGVRYERIPISERSTVTPGVRRTKRKRVARLDPGDVVEYKDYWGLTPANRIGREVNCVLKPVSRNVVADKKPKPAQQPDQFLCITDPATGNETSHRIVESTSAITPTNVKGEQLCPEDDVLYHTFMSTPSFKCGSLFFKRYSEKSTSRTGDNTFVFHVVKGKVNLCVNEKQFGPLSNGYWCHIPPNTSYSVTNDTRGTAEVLFYINKSRQ